MGQAFVESDPEAAALMELAERISGFPIHALCCQGPLADLTRVLYLQPALTAVNLICLQQLRKALPDFTPAFFAGHSLGEYSALYGAGVITLEDTLALVTRRGQLMEREGEAHPGGMRAVVGLNIDQVEAALAGFPGPGVVVANHNTASQIVLSGDEAGLTAVGAACTALGGKVIPLNVSVANHSPLVAGAVDDFAAFMAGIPFKQPETPVLFNVTGGEERDPGRIREIMARQIAMRVRWLAIVERMIADGVELFVELGPKSVLCGMIKKILPKESAIRCVQADTPESLAKVVAMVAGE